MYGEFDRELAEARIEQEREAAIAAARQSISRPGRTVCECGASISDLRRERFGAVRCLECQRDYEKEEATR